MGEKENTATIVAVTAVSLVVLALGLALLLTRQPATASSGPVKLTPTPDGGFILSDPTPVRRF